MSDPVGPTDEVTYELRRAAALLLLRGTAIADTVATMVREGVGEEEAAAVCGRLYTDPAFEAGERVGQELRKLESVLTMRQQMRDLSPPTDEIDRRCGLRREEFLHEYYAPNRPVILEDVCDSWPALDTWTPEYLARKLHGAEVEVMTGRASDQNYEVNSAAHRTRMPFDEYVARLRAVESSNDLYLVANNKLLESEAARPLWDDFTLDPRYLQPDTKRAATFLWLGPAGTVTPLHHDLMNVLFHQVSGWKRFILISPLETHCVSNSVGVFSDVDPVAPDEERFPRFETTHRLQVSVGPGEVLFIPVGWWHHVAALEVSISLSTTSFAFANTIAWTNPTRILSAP